MPDANTTCILTTAGPLYLDEQGQPLNGASIPAPMRWPLVSTTSIPQIRTGYDGADEIGEVWILHPACHLAGGRSHASSREGRKLIQALRDGQPIGIYDWSDPGDPAPGATWTTRGTLEQAELAIWGATLATSSQEEGLVETIQAERAALIEDDRRIDVLCWRLGTLRETLEQTVQLRRAAQARTMAALGMASTPATLGDQTRIELARAALAAAVEGAGVALGAVWEAEASVRSWPAVCERLGEIRELLRLADGAPNCPPIPGGAALARVQQAEQAQELARLARIQACAELDRAEQGERLETCPRCGELTLACSPSGKGRWACDACQIYGGDPDDAQIAAARAHAEAAWAAETEAAGALQLAREALT